ncbi:MEDS domain-containing protein [Candidatus Bipolaricaulota bacterium]|nr:MEDS domain-containing protein [Candidatus Bipolaricaulota bacterium]
MAHAERQGPTVSAPHWGAGESDGLKPGDHLCLIYRTEDEHRAVLTGYIGGGLERGERVLYIADARTARQIRGSLRDAGIDARGAEKRGQLVFLTGDGACTRDGVFDPHRMIALLREETQRALDDGFTGLRVVGEMAWVLRGLPGSERLIEYEALLNEFFPGSACTGLCPYDARRFSPEILLDVLRTHPIAIIGTQLYDNFYCAPPRELRGGRADQAMLDRWVASLERNETLLSALRTHGRVLEERVREPTCLQRLRQIASQEEVELAEILQAAPEVIRSGWRWPDLAQARIEYEGKVYASEGFAETPWRQSTPLERDGRAVGVVEVAYPDPPPAPEPFLPEEQELLDDIAHWLSQTIQLHHARERLLHLNAVLRAIRNVNQLIVREKDTDALIRKACELLTEMRGFACAWIALVDERSQPVRWAGTATPDEMEALITGWRKRGPPLCVQQALADDVAVIEGVAVACAPCPMAIRYGPAAGVAVRLSHGDHVYGILVVGVPPQFAAEQEELDLLKEIAGDLALALHTNLAEAKLREAEERYLDFFRRNRDGFVMVDTEGHILDANPAYCDMLGYSLDELQALPDFYAITPERWHVWERTEIWEKRLLVHGESGVYEKEYVRKDGSLFPVELQAFAVRDAHGAIAYLWAVVRDATRHKEEKRKRELLVQRLTVLHRVAQEITRAAGDPEQVYATIHRAVAELMPAEAFVISLRTGEEEAEAVYLVDVGGRHPPERVPRGEGMTWQILSIGSSVFILDTADGIPFKARRFGSKKSVRSLIAVPLRVGETTVGMLSTQSYKPRAFAEEDLQILEMLAAHAGAAIENARLVTALRKSEERFRRLAENAPDLIYRYRLKPSPGFEYVSPSATRITGYTPEEHYADPELGLKLVHPDDRPVLEALRAGMGFLGSPVQFRWVRKDGQIIWIEQISIPVYDEKGELVVMEGIARDITERKKAEDERLTWSAAVEGALYQLVDTLASAMELRDPYTAGHQRRVAELACAIAEDLNLPEERVHGLRVAALLHDIGKALFVPTEILSKPGKLTELEMALIREHPKAGYDVLKGVEFPWPVAEVVYQHHERVDGSGYPRGLKGDEILLEARILAVADVVEAMSSHRPYRPAHPLERALVEIRAHRGVLYDPAVVDACLSVFRRGFAFP